MRRRLFYFFFALIIGCAVSINLSAPAMADIVNVTTYHYDNARTGQNTQETLLTPQNVNSATFGRLFSHSVDGQVYAQPLYVANVNVPAKGVHNLLLVATQHDSVYAFDADNSQGANAGPLWQRSFINPTNGVTTVPGNETNSGDITVEIGITGTPVIGLGAPDGNGNATGTIYFVTKTKEIDASNVVHYIQRLHALDITTGNDTTNSPVVIGDTTTQNGYTYISGPSMPGTGDGSINGVLTFNALREHQRPGLVLAGGNVYVSFASHGDNGPYHGWVLAYDAVTLNQSAVFNTTPNGGLGGIWMSGEAPAVDTAGNVYFITGNANFDVNQFFGSTPQYQFAEYGDSFVRLQANLTFQHYSPAYPSDPTSFLYHSQDFFSPSNQASLNSADTDVGSGGLVLLPDSVGSAAHPHLLIGCGKEGKVYLLDRDNLGGFNLNGDNVVQEFSSDGTWSSPAYWNGAIYYQGSGGALKRFPISNGTVNTSNVLQSGDGSGFPGSTPTISSNGTTNGIAWTIQTDAYGYNGQAVLHAYDALNPATELFNSTQLAARDNPGIACKFTLPVVTNGKVYVGTQDQISVYGLGPSPLTATPVIAYSGGGYVGDTLTLTDGTPGASIYYTTDGSIPTTASHLYIAPFVISASGIYQAKAFAPGELDSAVASRFFGLRGTDGHGNGLKAVYFHGVNLDPTDSGGVPITQVDPIIDYSKPNFPISFNPQDNFSVRWSGQVQPRFDGAYTFTTVSDDGVRLWVNGQEIINDWTYHGPTTDTGTITLAANQRYNIVMEFFQGTGGADAHLSWSSSNQEPQIIPQSQLYSGAPDAPTGLTAIAGDGKVVLVWSASPGADNYTVKRATVHGGPYSALPAGASVPGTAFTDFSAANGVQYYYVVDAVNTLGTSNDSAEAAAKPAAATAPPSAPAGLTAKASDKTVALSWTSLSVATTYNVYRGTAPSGEGKTPLATGLLSASYIDNTVTDGQTYYYRVAGVNSAGIGAFSNEAAAKPVAPSINYPAPTGFTNAAGLQLNGSAQISGSRLRLTDGQNWEAGSAFSTTQIGVGSFITDFQFQMATPNADGFTFCLQGSAPTALGGQGGGLGYYQIGGPSIAVKFDLYNNDGEGVNSTGLYINGVNPMVPATDLTGTGIDLHSGDVIAVHMSYDGATLTVTETDTQTSKTATQTYATNLIATLGNMAFAGFTGATGGAGVTTDILNWTLGPPVSAVSVLTTLTVSPAKVSLSGGQTQTFTATAYDQFANVLSPAPSITWSVDPGGAGNVDANGVYSAGAVSGTATIRATAYGISAAAQAIVSALPTAPTGLSASVISPTEIDLFWTSTDNSQTGLIIERSTDGGTTFTAFPALAANRVLYADTGLTPATTYMYRIKSVNPTGTSSPSATVTATTQDVAPKQASNLTATVISSSQLHLQWQDNSINESGFHLYRKTGSGGTFILLATIPASPGTGGTVQYEDANLSSGTYYEYHLKAFNAVAEAADFAGAHATTITDAPAGLKAFASNGQVALSWTSLAAATSYIVYRGTKAGGEGAVPLATGLSSAAYADTSVSNGQTYFYRVTAIDDGGESLPSAEVSSVPAYPVPAITTLTPASASIKAPNVLLTLTGFRFLPGLSVVHWQNNGQDTPLATFCGSASSATATLPASLLSAAGKYTLTIANPAPGGGSSAPVSFTVGIPQITTTLKFTRSTTGQIVETMTVTNSGMIDVNHVFLTTSILGRYIGVARPNVLGTLPAGASKSTTLLYPNFSGAAGTSAVLRMNISYDGGYYGHTALVVVP